MRFEADLPCEYSKKLWGMPPFDSRGRITKRVSNGLENTLYLYSSLAKKHALESENNPVNFLVENVRLVGSGARENKVLSDVDFLLLCPKIDETSAKDLRKIISYVFLCDRPKSEAIDVYIRPYDKYAERGFVDITPQVENLIIKYNAVLLNKHPSCKNDLTPY